MRDKTHNEQIERWAIYVKENPNEWKKKVKPFIDSQFIKSREFYKRLLKTKGGEDKLRRIRNLN
jgi:hypothetical protein